MIELRFNSFSCLIDNLKKDCRFFCFFRYEWVHIRNLTENSMKYPLVLFSRPPKKSFYPFLSFSFFIKRPMLMISFKPKILFPNCAIPVF